LLSQHVSDAAAERNLDFMSKYATKFKMTPRNITTVAIDESLVNSGDFFGIIRLDGLDPMLAWAMGSSTGHTTVALRDEQGDLYVVESNAKGAYWPVNGIQKTPYATWIQQAQNADYNYLWAPLSPSLRATFNETAAWEYFYSVQGVDYGYYTLLYPWIDTIKDNYPCLPPDYSACLEWQHIEVLMGLLDRLSRPTMDMLFGQAFNHRLGTQSLSGAEIFQEADIQGLSNINLIPTIVEDDTWNYTIARYNDTVQAPSSVCCVFVCHIWKAAGLFTSINNTVNCGEFTNADDYQLSLLDADFQRPAQCASADPNNQLCQLNGKFSLDFNEYASRPNTFHMFEHCPSLPPSYDKPAGC